MSDGKKYSVYCIRNKVNGRRYIGQSSNPFSRLQTHINALRREADGTANFRRQHKQTFIDDFKEYGISAFSFGIIKDGIETEQDARKAELKAIEEYDSIDFGYNTQGLNTAFLKPFSNDEFRMKIKHKLLDLGKTNLWLCEEVQKKTGKCFNDSYLSKLCRGVSDMPEQKKAISEILELEEQA